MQNVIVLVIDGLQPAWLGPYGNTWIPTPHFNQLATQSLALDRYWQTSPTLAGIYHRWWGTSSEHSLSLPGVLEDSRRKTILLTDDPSVTQWPAAEAFADQMVVPIESHEQLAEDWTATNLAQFFAQATETLLPLRTPFAAWLHTGSLGKIWDAPLALREQFVEEDDPEAITATIPPEGIAAADPDALWSWRQAAAAQVMVLDECLGTWLEAWDESPLADDTWLVVLSGRGYPLAEHGRWGMDESLLTPELLRGAALIRAPQQRYELRRSPWLAQPSDLWPTLSSALSIAGPTIATGQDWNRATITPTPADWTKSLIIQSDSVTGLITPHWWYTHSNNRDEPKAELYLQPDDYFAVNNVASRCSEQVAACAAVLAANQQPDADQTLPAILDENWG
jgi:arylsulfatase A-like enzyme